MQQRLSPSVRTDRHSLSDGYSLQAVLKGLASVSGFFQLMLPINKAMLHGGNQSKGWQRWGRASWGEDTISVSTTAAHQEAVSYLWGFPAAAALSQSR